MKAGAIALALGLVLFASSEARADEARTDALVTEAALLEQNGDVAGAADKLERAFRDTERPDVAGKLGLLEAKSGEFARSAQHLELAMRFFPEKGRPEDRQRLIEAFTDVRAKVAAVRFRVKPDADRVRIDGKAPTLTTLDFDVFVMPGKRRIEVPGRGAVTIDAVANGSYPIDVVSVEKPADEPRSTTVVTKRPVWPIVVGSILSAGGLGLGIGATVVANQKAGDAKSIAKSTTCAGPSPSAACLASGYRATGDHNTFQAVGIGGFAVGGALLVSTITYALWPETTSIRTEKKKSTSSLVMVPAVGLDRGALSLEGSF